MSLNWDWKEKCGTATYYENYDGEAPRTYTVDLFVGNAYLIFIYQFKEDGVKKYTLNNFWADKTHMNRCLGIDKKYKATYGKNMYETPHAKLTKIKLNKAKCPHVNEIVTALTNAFDSIEIKIYNK